jgi:alkanesulfonate monooxygenase SsuD/methylene tetrahydromethanopterin reductase-like flavin-dependent oxidoreductase (luciferase family)
MGQSFTIDAHSAFAFLAGAGYSIRVGLGVGLTPLRHPYDAALQARSLSSIGLERVSIAYGPGEAGFSRALLGTAYARPVSLTEEYVNIVKRLLTDGRVEFLGKHFTMSGELAPAPTAEIGAGVLRPAMAGAVARVGDIAVTWLVPAKYIADVLVPRMARERRAGQKLPRIVAIVPVALSRPGRSPLVIARAAMERHLRSRQYVEMLNGAGFNLVPDDPVSSVRQCLAQGLIAYGEPRDVLDSLAMYKSAGVDEIVLSAAGVASAVSIEDANKDLEAILRANQ